MRYWPVVLVAAVALFASLGLSGWALNDRFHEGTKTRVTICQQINAVKKILHDEHTIKLRRSILYLHGHPHGAPGIPRDLILQGIEDERRIVAFTRPSPCE